MSENAIEEKRTEGRTWLNRTLTPSTLRWAEIGLALVGSILVGIAFSILARGGPNSSDITMYMNVGMNGIKMPFILNRYFHVFLQAIFLKLASHPLEGYHAFWGFIIGLNTFLIYVSARKALRKSNLLHGILAVVIFFSFAAIAETSGVIVVDFTAMTMLTAFFAAYLLSLNHSHRNPWFVGLLGTLLFLAFKTKETTLPVGVLLLGLGWVDDKNFDLRAFLWNVLWVVCGVLAGMVVFGVLSWIFLGDPFFGLRISEWQEFLSTYAVYSSRVLETLNSLGDGNLADWYQGYWFEATLLPFVLYLISGVTLPREESFGRKVLWLVPLMYAALMIVSINNRLGYEIRFGLPVMPVLAILAPQFIDLGWPERKAQQKRLLLFAALGIAIAVGIRVWLRIVIPPQNLDLGSVVTLMYYPLLITLLFAVLFLFRKNLYANLATYLIVLSLMAAPVASNLRQMFVFRENQVAFTQVTSPFSEFEGRIVSDPDMRLYATYAVFDQYSPKIGKNIDELVALFNVYFDASTTRENFTYVESPADINRDILDDSFDYALLTMNDWIGMQDDAEANAQVRDQYEMVVGEGGDFVLLEHK